ncbi:Protein-tyrosine-phosphatase IBR5 [Vitis vinifera]|uniref:Protein-tyrosine-phosphatase IBR5 n=1 Tax=Vitis vinifera TaxID=29760 RepID=A0A438BQU1_VITVI|nr:Protein-tyrosine-phosphatase IBR5 [Vitis vinifera]
MVLQRSKGRAWVGVWKAVRTDFKDVWLVEMWEQIGKDNHRFTRQIHDWELEKVKAFFRKLLAKSIRSGDSFLSMLDFIDWLRSPAIVIAYLMKCKGWRFAQSYQWVKERRPSVELSQAVHEQLQEYERSIFGSMESISPTMPIFQPSGAASFTFGFPKANDPLPAPAFNTIGAASIFARPPADVPPHEFKFGAGQTDKNIVESPFIANPSNPNSSDIPMDSS